MKPHLDIAHHGTLTSEGRVEMTFDADSTAFLMSTLTDLYSDKELAVIREYSTNALDSHRAAKNPAPIEVSLPSSLNPTFQVTDHGVGMSVYDVEQHFSKYGWSSKRDSDDEVGILGLGCKSALTYTSQFTFTAVQDGIKAVVLVTRQESGVGAVQVLTVDDTDESDGVTVSIPVRDSYYFNDKAHDFFRYWEPGTVLIDGVAPQFVGDREDAIKLDDDVYIFPRNKYEEGDDRIVMGGVAYPVDNEYRTHLRPNRYGESGYFTVAFVGIGSVDFTPSREQLHYTERTKETLTTIKEFVAERLGGLAKAAVESAGSYGEALLLTQKWRGVYSHDYSYQGEKVPRSFQCGHTVERPTKWGYNNTAYIGFAWSAGSNTRNKAKASISLNVEEALKVIHVIGYKAPFMTAQAKKDLNDWAQANNYYGKKMHVYAEKSSNHKWLEGVAIIVNWADIKSKPVREKREKPKGTFYNTLDGQTVETKDIDTSKPVVWMINDTYKTYTDKYGNLANWAILVSRRDNTVVVLGANQVAKFQRDHPEAVEWHDYLTAICNDYFNSLTDLEWLQFYNETTIRESGLTKLDPEKLDDFKLATLVRELKGAPTRSAEYNFFTTVWSKLNRVAKTPPKNGLVSRINEQCAKYPLVKAVGSSYHSSTDDLHEYVNALWAKRETERRVSAIVGTQDDYEEEVAA